jgi:hypothetical protein
METTKPKKSSPGRAACTDIPSKQSERGAQSPFLRSIGQKQELSEKFLLLLSGCRCFAGIPRAALQAALFCFSPSFFTFLRGFSVDTKTGIC